MIRNLKVHNYKSLHRYEVELGRFNVFIGENGAGKSNLLEALGFAGAVLNGKATVEDLYNRGVRVAPAAMTRGAFSGSRSREEMSLSFDMVDDASLGMITVSPAATTDSGAGADWTDINPRDFEIHPSEPALFPTFLELLRRGALADAEILMREWTVAAGAGRSRELSAKLAHEQGRRKLERHLADYAIYNPNTPSLRGHQTVSMRSPLGIYGENLDVAFSALPDAQRAAIIERARCISWFEDIVLDPDDSRRFEGMKPGRSRSRLYFRDKFMRRKDNVFSAESTNEGILYLLFHLTLFASAGTPKTLAIDNLEGALNPQLCRDLTKHLAELAVVHDKQALITTHNPAILDGLNLHDDEQRLFVVSRNDAGHTVTERIRVKPNTDESLKLSELWMRGHLGGLPRGF